MLTNLSISKDSIEQHFAELGRIGNLGPSLADGFLRAAWSDEESAAMAYVKTIGQRHGLKATFDGVGNLFLRTPGQKKEVVQVGSHLDTVPRGGLFDGGAGIIAGLEAILALQHTWADLERDLELVVWRGEESATFDSVCKGSQAAFGLNDPEILKKEFEGRTLESAILSQGYDPSYIRARRPTLSPQHIDSIAVHFELHIEQAKKLETDRLDIGIATSARGTVRLRFRVTGQAAHSGGTPMGPAFRQDANLAMAYMQVELDRLANETLAEGHDLVQTVGIVNSDKNFNRREPRVYENALTKVSPFGYFTLDVRSNRQSFLADYVTQARDLIRDMGEKFGVRVETDTICSLQPLEELDESLQVLLEEICVALGYSYEKMPCGALHDVVVVSNQRRSNGARIPGGLILIPSKDGISHNPQEYSSPEVIQKGSMVLANALYSITQGVRVTP